MIKKSIFIKNGKYFYQDYTSNFPYHSIYCEVLGLSSERFFENNVSNMDIYLDIDNALYNFFKVLRNDESRKKIINILNETCINEMDKIETYLDDDNKDIIKALKFYHKSLKVLNDINDLEYLRFYSKRNDRYIDELLLEHFNEFGEHKKYLIPIVDRLREIQVHKFQNEYIQRDHIKNFMDLYDDELTLFGFDLYDTDIDLYKYQNIIDFACDKENNVKGLIHIVCNDENLNIVLSKLNGYEFTNDILNNNITGESKYEFSIEDDIVAFKFTKKKYNHKKIIGTVVNLLEFEAKIFTDKGFYIDVPYVCLEKFKKDEEKESVDSPINWYGGKYYLAKDILDIFPKNQVKKYVEVFGGAAHVFFRKSLVEKFNIYNDKNAGLYSFFDVLSGKNKRSQLIKKLILTPYHQLEWEKCYDWEHEVNKVEKSRQFYVRTMQSRSSNGGWGFTRDKKYSRRSMAASVSKWLGNIENNIPAAARKLEEIRVENNDFRESLRKHDSYNTLFYLDPPYVPETRTLKNGYKYELSIDDHEILVDILLNIKGKVVLSGYDNEIYRRLETEGDFKKILIKEAVKSSVNVNREERTGKEYVWINYDIDNEIKSMNYFCNDMIIGFSENNTTLYNQYLVKNRNNEDFPHKPKHKVSKREIKRLERKIGIELPEDYREFLLKFNGGMTKPHSFLDIANIIGFFGVGENLNDFNLDSSIEIYKDKLPSVVIPIGKVNKDKLLCINLNEEFKGIYTHDIKTGKSEKHANTFSEFINSIA
ncbi:TPA: SMI1/KNR4 family protein [Clostridioides difficile]|nr:SMI1/KNR4 family protein [Clostridioides difficile]HBF5147680.1 SMI1/KNR4 family protein [Clostridioides difficile]